LSSYLLLDAERVDVAEGDVPRVEPVGVVGARREEERGGEEEGSGGGGEEEAAAGASG